jgi:3-dehydroquinate synthase
MANALSVKLNLINKNEATKIENLLKKYNIPTKYNIKDINNFYNNFFLDKKALDNDIKFILPIGIGDCEIKNNIKKDIIIDVLGQFR